MEQTAISFEGHLLQLGYEQYTLESNGFKKVVAITNYYSSMSPVCSYWIKDGSAFCVGLSERDKPITLIRPFPIALAFKMSNNEPIRTNDDTCNKVLSSYSNGDIFDSLIDNSKGFYNEIKDKFHV